MIHTAKRCREREIPQGLTLWGRHDISAILYFLLLKAFRYHFFLPFSIFLKVNTHMLNLKTAAAAVLPTRQKGHTGGNIRVSSDEKSVVSEIVAVFFY